MPLIKSISGIRGTIGGRSGENLTPLDIVKFSAAYGAFIKQENPGQAVKIIIGRDGRESGKMVSNLVAGTLLSQGINVVDLELAATPTVEMAVIDQAAQGGLILSASHNPQGWNALKLLNQQGEFLTAADGKIVWELAEQADLGAVAENKLGSYSLDKTAAARHIQAILALTLVKAKLIAAKKFKVVVDGINSIGGRVVPELLRALGVNDIVELNCQPDGKFAHRPEPLSENLADISRIVRQEKADLGIVVDPDVDRLAFIDEKGAMFGEEYTLVAVAEYVLASYGHSAYQKIAVSNLSSSHALRDVAERLGGAYYAAAVGEINVVEKMKETAAAIGGEGNGGVIYLELHYGRDALIGIALFLSALAETGQTMSEFKKHFPEYYMVKDRLELNQALDWSELLDKLKRDYASAQINDSDGLKIDWPDSWVQLRASNTEPILRIYAEAKNLKQAEQKVQEIKDKILAYIKQK